jgi:hypothetical protein
MNHIVKSLYVEIRRDEYDALRARVAEIEQEAAALREIISRSAEACGGYMDNACSLEFMALLPAEIKAALLKSQPSGGAYSADPLACSGCASGCFRCRSSAADALDDVIVPTELAARLCHTDNHIRQTARRELRNTLLALQVKP